MISYIAATALVLVCSVTESRAQQTQQQQRQTTVVNRTVNTNTTNVYNNGSSGGWGWNGGYRGGSWGVPGAGPYDSAIAVAGIVAGASVLNNIISSRQPQVIVQQQPVVVQSAPVMIQQAPVFQSGPGCITAMASDGNYYRYCR